MQNKNKIYCDPITKPKQRIHEYISKPKQMENMQNDWKTYIYNRAQINWD